MRDSRQLRALAFLLVLVPGLPDAADAQTIAARRQAARLFRQGEREYRRDQYEQALGSFQQALELMHHPATEFNIGMCLEKLGRLNEADAAYARVEQGNRRRLAQKARRARQRIASLVPTLRVAPASDGSQILVDGEPCETPCERRVDPGEHEVVVAAGEGEVRETVQVEPGDTFTLSLQPLPPEMSDDPASAVLETEGPRRTDPALGSVLLWGGVGTAAVGLGILTYFALANVDDQGEAIAFATLGLGITVVGVGAALAGIVYRGRSAGAVSGGAEVSGSEPTGEPAEVWPAPATPGE